MEVLVLVSMGSWKEDIERAEIEGRGPRLLIATQKELKTSKAPKINQILWGRISFKYAAPWGRHRDTKVKKNMREFNFGGVRLAVCIAIDYDGQLNRLMKNKRMIDT